MVKDNPLRKRLLVLDNIARSSSANTGATSFRVGALNAGKSTVLGHGAFVGYDTDSAGALSPNASIVSGNNLEDDSSLKNSLVTNNLCAGEGGGVGDLMSMTSHPILSHEYINTVNIDKYTIGDDGSLDRIMYTKANGNGNNATRGNNNNIKGAKGGPRERTGCPNLLPLLIKRIAPMAYANDRRSGRADATSPSAITVRKVAATGDLTARSGSSDELSFGKKAITADGGGNAEEEGGEGAAARGSKKSRFKRHPTRPPVTRHLYKEAPLYAEDREKHRKVNLRPSTAPLNMSARPTSKSSAVRGGMVADADAVPLRSMHVDILLKQTNSPDGSPVSQALQDMSPSKQSIVINASNLSPPELKVPPAANPVHPLSRFNDDIFDDDFASGVRRVTKILSRRDSNFINDKTGTRFTLHAPAPVAVAGTPIKVQQKPPSLTATTATATEGASSAARLARAALAIDTIENDPSSYFGGSLTAYVNQFLSPAAVAEARAQQAEAEHVAAGGAAAPSRPTALHTPLSPDADRAPSPIGREPLAAEGDAAADRAQRIPTLPSYAQEQRKPEAVLIKHQLIYHRHKLGHLKQLNPKLKTRDASSRPEAATGTIGRNTNNSSIAAGVVMSDGVPEDMRYFEGVGASLIARPRRAAPVEVPEPEPEHDDDNSIFNHALSAKISQQVQQYKTVKEWIDIGDGAEEAIANLSIQRKKNVRDFYDANIPTREGDAGAGIVWFQRPNKLAAPPAEGSNVGKTYDFASLEDSNRIGNTDDIYDMFCGNLSTDSFMITEDVNSAITSVSPVEIISNRNFNSNNMRAALGTAPDISEETTPTPTAAAVVVNSADKAVSMDKTAKKPTAKERLYLHLSSHPVMDLASQSMPFSPRSSKVMATNNKKLVARTILSKKYLLHDRPLEGDVNAHVVDDENELEIFNTMRRIEPKIPTKVTNFRS